ncbi:hypothetical protein BDV23DRAFT_149253 [Aspergillus alliaceus]|uniref:Xylanolytic transcriptional activator regulatory domain-containing protein n=1 Tax=Petromyces alliaceus TaxID=209559 RepID=A0A5N7CHC8_PETAA|nr:hypothetical protein BDV23DRAFT_149253 [Aspergillus alliaceus]
MPKCSTCRPWPGACQYSRDESSSQSDFTSIPITAAGNNMEARLQHLERTVRHLSDSVHRVFQTISSARPRADNTQGSRVSHLSPVPDKDRLGSNLYVSPFHSFSFLRETLANIETISQPPGSPARQSAYSELQYLSTRLTTAHVHRDLGEEVAAFYVPSRPVGYRLISRFYELSNIGDTFFRAPTDDIVRQVVFEPHKVREKAWVIYLNYLLLCAASAKNEDTQEIHGFRRNVELALNDSRIFLEPREANVQALALLALHGEDYAAPNLSWMLLGHACRQAEALGLHERRHDVFNPQQQSLCLFWLLFMMDKSCALAFGRPVFLSTAIYRDLPLPDDEVLLNFHLRASSDDEIQQAPSHGFRFGAHFLRRSMELSRLTGLALDVLATGESSLAKRDVWSRLDGWYLETKRVLTEAMDAESCFSNATQLQEMALGINSIKFHYLHTLIVLLKGDELYSTFCLPSAREAISLLSSMVSNWSSIYNGVVWQLLYYPFTPFFVIFKTIIHQRRWTAAIEQDLRLLSTTVSYYAEMRSQMRLLATVCERLQRVAATFFQLAQAHVHRHFPQESAGGTVRAAEMSPMRSHEGPDQLMQQIQANKESAFNYAQSIEALASAGVGDPNVSNYLQWLPADMATTWSSMDGIDDQGPISVHPASGSTTPKAFQSHRRMFDWFSWDAYYGGADS